MKTILEFFRPGSFISRHEVSGIAIFLFLVFVLGVILTRV